MAIKKKAKVMAKKGKNCSSCGKPVKKCSCS